jgi:predicted RNA-binding Zn-ribbon protein involved in translation (DUF1610 family)
MVEVLNLISIVKQYPEAMKLVKEILTGGATEIKPTTNLTTELGFTYPEVESLLGLTTQEVMATLEFLADEDILEKSPHTNLLFCPRCQAPNLRAGLGCPKCGSGNIAKGRILEHFACRNNSLEDEYMHDGNGKYTCPNCKQELKFLGTDYQSLGINYKCHECGAISNEAASNWQCLKCSSYFTESEAKETVLYSYQFNEEKRRWLKFELDEKTGFVDFFINQGYEVMENARVNGTTKSGADHMLDILARRDDGLITYTIGIGILINSRGEDIGLAEVFGFDNKVYDLGMHDKVLLALPRLGPEARQFARQQRIKVIEEEDLQTLLALEPPSAPKPSSRKPLKFETKSKLLEHLKGSGYRLEKKAKVLGRSGVEHTFDILATNDDGIITHTLGISTMIAKDEIDFDAVSAFDTRAYDVGIHDKLLLACPKLNHEAKQLAQYQRIKVIEVNDPAKLT